MAAATQTNAAGDSGGVWPAWATALAIAGATFGVIILVHLLKVKK